MSFDIITFGSATLDVFAQTDNEELINIHSKKGDEKLIAYPLGSKILITDLRFEIGGGGTNTAVCASRLGLKSAYLGNIGNDTNGVQVVKLLKEEKVEFVGTVSNDRTNYSIVLDADNDDRTILVYKGASEKFDFSKVDKKNLDAKWFYFCAMIGNGYKQLEKAAVYAKKNDIKIAFNPSSYLAEKGSRYLKKILEITDFLILNKEEAELLVGKGEKVELAKKLKDLGPLNVCVTDGVKQGIILYKDQIHKYMPKTSKVVETTGAGDAFGSSLISGLIIKNDIYYATKLALKNSKSVIGKVGAKTGLIRF